MTNQNTDNTPPELSDSESVTPDAAFSEVTPDAAFRETAPDAAFRETAPDAAFLEEADDSIRPFAENAPIAGYISAILRKLGENARSSVFLARTIEGRAVALKVYRDALPAENSDVIKKKLSALLELPSHPRVARPLECAPDYDARKTYVISEYVAGDTLERALMEEGPFSQAQVLNWMCQLLDATDYLHSHGLCAPLKLSNIIRKRDDSVCIGDMSYLLMGGCDFAEARQEGFESNKPDSPKPERQTFCAVSVFGNFYTAERKREEVTNDIYLTGAAAFHLFTGNPPRKDASMEEMKRTLSERGMSDSAAEAILKALNPDPEARYRSDAEALSALRALPLRDSRMRHMRLLRKAALALLPFLTLVSLSGCLLGALQAGHIREAAARRETARTALNEGDVSAALEETLQAMDREGGPFDPPRSADTQRALADALCVYDYSASYAPLRSILFKSITLEKGIEKPNFYLLSLSTDSARYAIGIGQESPPSVDTPSPSAPSPSAGAPPSAPPSADEAPFGMILPSAGAPPSAPSPSVDTPPSFADEAPLDMPPSYPSERTYSLYVIDLESGQALDFSIQTPARYIRNCAFADNDTLLCLEDNRLTAYGIDGNRKLWSEENVSYYTVAGEFIAMVSSGGDGARICRWTGKELLEESRVSFGDKRYMTWFSSSPADNAPFAYSTTYPNFLSLREDGQYLAVGSPEGLLRIYRCDESGEYAELLDDSAYTLFEGGFCGDVFAYAANGYSILQTKSLCQAFQVDNDAPARWKVLTRRADSQVMFHVHANKEGVYCVFRNQILKFDAENIRWEYVAEVDGTVQGMFCASGRIAVIVGSTLSMNENIVIFTPKPLGTGESDERATPNAHKWKQTQTFTGSFPLGMSGDFLLLFNVSSSRNSPLLSVWKWTDGAEKAESVLSYDGAYEHQFANITASGDAILYNRGPELFRIYPAGGWNYVGLTPSGDAASYISVTADDWEDILNIQYLREPETSGEPSGESLRVEYPERYDYYSVQDGQLLLRREKAGETDSLPGVRVLTKDYRVTGKPDGGVEIRSRRTGKTLLTLPEGTLLDASQCRDMLLVSYQRASGDASGVLLNRRMETVAEIPGPCALLPDGRLYVDDRNGRLFQGRLYNPEELTEMARERLR